MIMDDIVYHSNIEEVHGIYIGMIMTIIRQ